MTPESWFVYMVLGSSGKYYVGCSNNVKRRVHQHNKTKAGARCLRGQRPVELVWCVELPEGKIPALRVEYYIKRHTAKWKAELVSKKETGLGDLLPDHLQYKLVWHDVQAVSS